MVKKSVVAMLMCAAMVLIAAAPLAQSEAGTTHLIYKDENGPPSTCAETWEITPTEDGTWYGTIVNSGMRWLIIDVMDMDTGDMLIDREMYRYAVYGDDFDTEIVSMTAGHTYSITATPNGPLYTSCTVTDNFEGTAVPEPPVADFTVAVDGLTVAVDASSSYDPDGTIVSYDWAWGDGSVGTGETASHTYVSPEETVTAMSSPTLGDVMPPPSYFIWGFTKDSVGDPLGECSVTVTNVRLEESRTVVSTVGGSYMYDLANMKSESYGYYVDGDEILVEAVKDTLSGSAVGYIDLSGQNTQMDVTLEGETPPEPFDVTITLTVTDEDGLTTTVSETVTLYP